MPFAISELSAFWLTAGSCLVFLVAVAAGTVTVFRAQSAERDHVEKLTLLPSMEELRAAAATLVERRREVVEATERLRELHREQAEAERHCRDRDDVTREVEEIRTDYEEAVKDLTERRSEIDTLIEHRNRLIGEIGRFKTRLGELEDRPSAIREQDARIELDRPTRPKAEKDEAIRRLPNEIESLESRKAALTEEVGALRDQQEKLHSLRNELERLAAYKLDFKTDIEALEREKDRLLLASRTIAQAAHRAR